MLQPVKSKALAKNVPASMRDPEGHWYGMTVRSRVIVYAKDRVKPGALDLRGFGQAGVEGPRSRARPATFTTSHCSPLSSPPTGGTRPRVGQGGSQNMARSPRGSTVTRLAPWRPALPMSPS